MVFSRWDCVGLVVPDIIGNIAATDTAKVL
jgi:hypothetical protein